MAELIDSVSIDGLRLAHFRQLADILDAAKHSGSYWGHRQQHYDRLADLISWTDSMVVMLDQPGVIVPNGKGGYWRR